MSPSTSRPVSPEPWRLAALWSGLLTGPVVALMLLETNYVMAYVACETGRTWFMHMATAIALLLVAGAGYASWRAYDGDLRREASGGAEAVAGRVEGLSDPLSPETQRQRSRWMSLGGLLTSAWFIIVILAMEVPILVLKECQ